jgi:hypothetical protein
MRRLNLNIVIPAQADPKGRAEGMETHKRS